MINGKVTKVTKKLKKKCKLFVHVFDHALYSSKIVTNDSNHLPNE